MRVDVQELQVDLLSFSAHKFYGPKGVGALFVRREGRQVRLSSQMDGGGQEGGLRSGTLNVPGIVGMARAVELCAEEMDDRTRATWRRCANRLFDGLCQVCPRRGAQRTRVDRSPPAVARQPQLPISARGWRGSDAERPRRGLFERQRLYLDQSRAKPRAAGPRARCRSGPQQPAIRTGSLQHRRRNRFCRRRHRRSCPAVAAIQQFPLDDL